MSPDLISRSFGFGGVFIALCAFGYISEEQFIVNPKEQYSPLILNIQSAVLPQEESEQNIEEVEEIESQTDKNNQLEEQNDLDTPKNDIEPLQTSSNEKPTHIISQKDPIKNEIKKEEKIEEKKEIKEEKKQEVKKEKPKKVEPKKEVVKKVESKKAAATKTNDSKAKENFIDNDINLISAQKESALDYLLHKIRSATKYPKKAIKRKIQGVVVISFNLKNGKVVSYQIIKSSGHRILDEAANKLAKNLLNTDTKVRGGNITINVPIQYALK